MAESEALTMRSKPEVSIFNDADDLASHAADLFTQIVQDAIEARGRATVGLSGGSTPEAMYKLLAAPDRANKADWTKTLFFFGDERFVPYDDPSSNFGMARRTLLAGVEAPTENLFPMPTDLPSAAVAAERYEKTLRLVLGHDGILDLVLLGLGEDGHTASLFPGFPSLAVQDSWVVGTPPGTLPPPVDRITLTYPILNAARNVCFLAAGAKKAAVLREILEGDPPAEKRPAAGIHPENGTLRWLIDRTAAGDS
jgi:6-phosphogluconolactonase